MMRISLSKPIFGKGFFPLTFPWTCWFRNYRFWDGLQIFFAFQFKVFNLDVDGQELCEILALSVPLIHPP